MIYLHKLLPLLIMPTIVFILLILICTYKGYRKLIYFFSILFYIISTPIFSDFIMRIVEGEYFYQKLENLEKADAIVILGGMLKINEFENNYVVEWADADRFFKGIELYNSFKSDKIVFTGGKSLFNKTAVSEGSVLKNYAVNYGILEENITVTKDVFNTYEESLAVSEVLGENKTIILVTSAFHMKRAKFLFEKQNLRVIPYKVDYLSTTNPKLHFIDFLPSSSGLQKTEIALREQLGRLYYSFRW